MYYPLEATFSGKYELIALCMINIIRQMNDMKLLFSKVFMPLCFPTNPSILRVDSPNSNPNLEPPWIHFTHSGTGSDCTERNVAVQKCVPFWKKRNMLRPCNPTFNRSLPHQCYSLSLTLSSYVAYCQHWRRECHLQSDCGPKSRTPIGPTIIFNNSTESRPFVY